MKGQWNSEGKDKEGKEKNKTKCKYYYNFEEWKPV